MDGKPKEAKKVVPSERSIKIAVQIPEGESPEEWLAANSVFYALQLYSSTSAIDFYNQLNMLYGTLVERCTKESCPKMDAGTKFVYLWADGVKVVRGIPVSAPEYVEYLVHWINELFDDPKLFPKKLGDKFSPEFMPAMANIYKKLFRIYAHIYHAHLHHIIALELEDYLNTSFRQFLEISKIYGIVKKNDLAPLMELISSFGINFDEEEQNKDREVRKKETTAEKKDNDTKISSADKTEDDELRKKEKESALQNSSDPQTTGVLKISSDALNNSEELTRSVSSDSRKRESTKKCGSSDKIKKSKHGERIQDKVKSEDQQKKSGSSESESSKGEGKKVRKKSCGEKKASTATRSPQEERGAKK